MYTIAWKSTIKLEMYYSFNVFYLMCMCWNDFRYATLHVPIHPIFKLLFITNINLHKLQTFTYNYIYERKQASSQDWKKQKLFLDIFLDLLFLSLFITTDLNFLLSVIYWISIISPRGMFYATKFLYADQTKICDWCFW